jgi:hypothetical protein
VSVEDRCDQDVLLYSQSLTGALIVSSIRHTTGAGVPITGLRAEGALLLPWFVGGGKQEA